MHLVLLAGPGLNEQLVRVPRSGWVNETAHVGDVALRAVVVVMQVP